MAACRNWFAKCLALILVAHLLSTVECNKGNKGNKGNKKGDYYEDYDCCYDTCNDPCYNPCYSGYQNSYYGGYHDSCCHPYFGHYPNNCGCGYEPRRYDNCCWDSCCPNYRCNYGDSCDNYSEGKGNKNKGGKGKNKGGEYGGKGYGGKGSGGKGYGGKGGKGYGGKGGKGKGYEGDGDCCRDPCRNGGQTVVVQHGPAIIQTVIVDKDVYSKFCNGCYGGHSPLQKVFLSDDCKVSGPCPKYTTCSNFVPQAINLGDDRCCNTPCNNPCFY